MHARWLAVLLGTSLGGLAFGAGWLIAHRPAPMWELEVRAVDARGQPVTRFGWSITDFTPGATMHTGASDATHPDGIARVVVPEHEVTLSIAAPGLRRAVIGPFRPETVRARLEARLEDLGVVEGVVVRDGKPMPGASVVLLRPSSNSWDDKKSGLYYGFSEDRAETDDVGRFRLPTDSDGIDLWARAWRAGSASGTTGPVRVGAPPIQVALHEGGTLEGHLKLEPDRDVADCEIELYRREERELEPGAFERFFARVEPAGTFVFQHVDTGPWLVRLNSRGRAASVEAVPFIVSIEEGNTTRLEMDLMQPPLELVGQLTMNGRPWSPVWPALYSIGEKTLCLDSVEADPSGTWTLRARAPGRYQLFICGNHQHDTSVPARAWGEVELLQGRTRFERSLVWSQKDLPDVRLDQSR